VEAHSSAPAPSYYRYFFANSLGRKCLIFANDRAETQAVSANLRQIAERNRLPDIYRVHQGSICAPLREAAETAVRDGAGPAVTAATVTLEPGIDIGQWERVVQPPHRGQLRPEAGSLRQARRSGGDAACLPRGRTIAALVEREVSPEELLDPDEAPRLQKYDEFIPPAVLRQAFAADWPDVAEVKAALAENRTADFPRSEWV